LHTGLDVIRALGRIEKAVEVLERITNAHGERIQQLIQKTDRTDFALPIMENAIVRHAERMRALERVAHFGEFIIGSIAGASALVYLYYTLVRHASN